MEESTDKSSQEIKYGKLTLLLNDSSTQYAVTDCDKETVEVEIPAKVNGIPVTEIAQNAFADCIKLERVNFPEYSDDDYIYDTVLREIGGNAFMNCSALKTLDIPESVQFIGHGAFYWCTGLTEVTFSKRAYVSAYAFSRCTSLKSVTPVSLLNDGVFSHCESLAYMPITDEVDEISEDAFEHCNSLAEITIPANVEAIESLAFRNAFGLKKVTFEITNGWYWHCRYDSKDRELDVSDPEKNAQSLQQMDFDDGVSGWYRK